MEIVNNIQHATYDDFYEMILALDTTHLCMCVKYVDCLATTCVAPD